MLSYDRQEQILAVMRKQKSASVNELADRLAISVSTIRRDLKEMEVRGDVARVHGGAVIAERRSAPESPVLLRQDINAEAKRRIGKAAAQLVEDGDTIILTAGSTVETILPHLVERQKLTVVTNVIHVAYKLAAHPHITVVVLGGWLRHSEYSLLGQITQQALSDFHVDKIFHGTYGLVPDYGLTGTYVQEVETDRYLINAAEQLIVMADASKFRQAGPIRLVPTERIDTVVTDDGVPDADVEKLEACGVQVIKA